MLMMRNKHQDLEYMFWDSGFVAKDLVCACGDDARPEGRLQGVDLAHAKGRCRPLIRRWCSWVEIFIQEFSFRVCGLRECIIRGYDRITSIAPWCTMMLATR